MPRSIALPELSLRVQRCCSACSGRRVQSRVLVFKDGHPSLVRLPSPVSSRLATMSRRSHPVALAEAGARSVETVEHRTSDAPSWSSVGPYCQVPPTARLEPSRPPCGETQWRPDSSAPSANTPRVDGLRQSSRSTRAHASEHRLLQSSRPTDTFDALCASRQRDLSAPLLPRESEKQQLSLLSSNGLIQRTPDSLSRSSDPICLRSTQGDQRNSLVENAIVFPQAKRVSPNSSTRNERRKLRLVSKA
jgi:hypothetical protein